MMFVMFNCWLHPCKFWTRIFNAFVNCVWKLGWALFSKFIDFDGPNSKGHISGYNYHSKQKLGSIELYGNTV